MLDREEIKKKLKLGAFIVSGFMLFITIVYFLGRENSLLSKTFVISSIFKNVEGLKEGDNVWLSGVKIGTVKKVEIISQGKVLVSFSLKDKQNKFIRKDATAIVSSDGFVGNKIVLIIPGTSPQIVQHNDTIKSESPTNTQELFDLAKDVGTTTRTIIGDLKRISSRLNSGEGIVGELLHDGPISTDLRKVIVSLKESSETTAQFAKQAQSVLHEMSHGEGIVASLLTDTTYVDNFKNTMVNIEKVGENTSIMTKDLQATIARLNDSNNAIGVLLSDSVFATKLKGTMDHAQSASIRLDSNMLALKHNFLLKGYFKKQEKKKLRKQK